MGLAKNKTLVFGLGILALLVMGRFLGPAMMPVVRIVALIALGYFVVSKIKNLFLPSPPNSQRQNLSSNQYQTRNNDSEIIDMCPRCGALMSPGHRC